MTASEKAPKKATLEEKMEYLAETKAILNDNKRPHALGLADEVYQHLEDGLKANVIGIDFLKKVREANAAYGKLWKEKYPSSTINETPLEAVSYLAAREVRAIKSARRIKNLKDLRAYAQVLPLYLKKAEAISNIFPGTGHGLPLEVGYYIKGAKDVHPLTAAEMKAVHKMSVKKAIKWLTDNTKRFSALGKAVQEGQIKDEKTVQKFRSMDPAKAIAELAKMDKAHKARKESTQKKRDDAELKRLEAQF